jgi:hypothetical protein
LRTILIYTEPIDSRTPTRERIDTMATTLLTLFGSLLLLLGALWWVLRP